MSLVMYLSRENTDKRAAHGKGNWGADGETTECVAQTHIISFSLTSLESQRARGGMGGECCRREWWGWGWRWWHGITSSCHQLYTYIHTYIHIYIHTCVCVRVRVRVCVCVCLCLGSFSGGEGAGGMIPLTLCVCVRESVCHRRKGQTERVCLSACT